MFWYIFENRRTYKQHLSNQWDSHPTDLRISELIDGTWLLSASGKSMAMFESHIIAYGTKHIVGIMVDYWKDCWFNGLGIYITNLVEITFPMDPNTFWECIPNPPNHRPNTSWAGTWIHRGIVTLVIIHDHIILYIIPENMLNIEYCWESTTRIVIVCMIYNPIDALLVLVWNGFQSMGTIQNKFVQRSRPHPNPSHIHLTKDACKLGIFHQVISMDCWRAWNCPHRLSMRWLRAKSKKQCKIVVSLKKNEVPANFQTICFPKNRDFLHVFPQKNVINCSQNSWAPGPRETL